MINRAHMKQKKQITVDDYINNNNNNNNYTCNRQVGIRFRAGIPCFTL